MTIIGRGSYGVVYRPPIPCNKKYTQNKLIVGKVFSSVDDYEDEIAIAKKIQKLNSANEFSIPFYQTCPENLEIIYGDGGKDLDVYLKTADKEEFHDIMAQMKYLVYGIQKLLKHNYVHQDIKLENIVYNGKKMYLIDFGLICRTSEIYNNDSFLKYTYLAFPPEYKRHYYNKNYIPQFLKNIQSHLRFIKKIYPNYLEDLEILKNTPYYPSDKMDIYSLGMVIMQVYKFYNKYDEKTESIIRDMICFDPNKRLNIKELIEKYWS